MAAITDPKALLAIAQCQDCFGSSPGQQQLLIIALLNQIAIAQGAPLANLTPSALLASANCFSCYASSPGQMQLLIIALLAQIAANPGGGGGGAIQITDGAVNPVAPPANPAITNAYLNNVSGVVFWWKAGGNAWQ